MGKLFVRYDKALNVLSKGKTKEEQNKVRKMIKIAVDKGLVQLDFDLDGAMVITKKIEGELQ